MAGTEKSDEMLQAERDVAARISGFPVDLAASHAISDIYRAAAAVRRKAERELLAVHKLSWGGFTILWVLWIWGPMETARLAAECDLAKGTLTGMVSTLEKQELVTRERQADDRRRVTVALTDEGVETISALYPVFNDYEAKMTSGLNETEKEQLASLLRVVINNASD